MEPLAIDGGHPVRQSILPYGRQTIEQADIDAVVEVLQSDWLTTGPKVGEFEAVFAEFTGAKEAVAVSNGTAALHTAVSALDIGPGDEVIVTPMTFAASANCVVYQGATPVFADVDSDTLLIDPSNVAKKVSKHTKAIIAVDYAGHPCDYDALRQIATENALSLIDDACHAIGGTYKGKPVGSLADLNTFSLHPVKHMTTGEGGVVTTDDPKLKKKMRVFRNHGITTDHRQRAAVGSFFYEMVQLGFNYRITDFQCALGISQLERLSQWVTRRQEIAAAYDKAFANLDVIRPLTVRPDVSHGYHLYMIQLELEQLTVDRAQFFQALRAEGLGVNVHYVPVHLHPFYQQKFGTRPGLCPVAEAAYERLISLPVFPLMSAADVEDVITAVYKVAEAYTK